MSLRINTNLPAVSALRNLSTTNDSMSTSISRLSTGLRIVSAADDPAGLVASENMRAQIKGIGQAMSNSQNAINMAKTAEGGMEEVQTLLSDMRALAVQSANTAVVDATQLQANQNQIANSLSSINRIASSTQWGTKKLLDGTAGVRTNVTDTSDIASAYFGSTFNGMTIANGPITIQRTTAATQTSLTTDQTFASSSSIVAPGSIVVNGYTFAANGTSDTVQDVIDKINAQSANTGVTASTIVSGGNVSVKLTSTDYGSDFPVDFYDTTGIFNSTPHPAATVAGTDAVANVTATVLAPNGTTTTTTVQFTGGQGPHTSGLYLTDNDGNRITMTSYGNGAAALTSASSVGVVTAGDVQFQIGSMAGQSVTFSMPDIRTTRLGTNAVSGQSLADVDLTTSQGANDAIKIIDDAITSLASLRGDLGSFQKNVLESQSRSLSVASENATAAESAIRDADLAGEMTNYTKLQILQQSGTAVLAQANQMPSQILKLLQG